MIQAGEVWVNNKLETRRRRTLHVGDNVTFAGTSYVVAFDDDSTERD